MVAELTYFDMSGLGDHVRMMLSYGNIPFEDKRVNKQEWAALKPHTKYGQLPRLKIDGVELYQSRAICRYIASKLKLRGKDDIEAAFTDMWVDAFDDLRLKVIVWYYQKDSDERTENMKNKKNVEVPAVLKGFENSLEKEGSSYFVGGKITWADIMFAAYMVFMGELLKVDSAELLRPYPRLSANFKSIMGNSGVQNYFKVRPAAPPDFRVLFQKDVQ